MADFNHVVSSYFTFFDTNGDIINHVKVINVSDSGAVESIIYTNDIGEDITLNYDEFTYTNLAIDVPGIGIAYCGDIVYLEQFRKQPTQFELQFGWHENVSNQKIFSWYLKPTEKSNVDYIKTLYYEDLTNIIGITRKSNGTLIVDNRYDTPIFVNELIKIIGVLYQSFTINSDGTATFVDLDNIEHTLTPTYVNDQIVSLLYDGYPVELEYDDEGNLISVGETTFNVADYNGGNGQ